MIQLRHEFPVDLPVAEAWDLLTDLPKVARCLPGASLDDVVDGEYRGGLSTRIGPISAKYHGTASFIEHDEVGRRVVIEARGREEKGSGSASALITATLNDHGDGTIVTVSTELSISGRAAQFGRSLLAEVSNTMMDEFARRLEAMIAGGDAAASGADQERAGSAHGRAPSTPSPSGIAPDEELDVLTTVVLPMLRRIAVPVGAALVGAGVGVILGRRGRDPRRSAYPAPVPCWFPHEGGPGTGGCYVIPEPRGWS